MSRPNWPRRLLCSAAALTLLCAASFGWLMVFVAHMEDTTPSPPVEAVAGTGVWKGYMGFQYDCIIILGAQVKPNGSPSEALLRRMELALEYYNARPCVIIATGGRGEDEPMAEGDFMYRWLRKAGAPDDALAVDNMSRNTRENIANAKALMAERGLERALVVTSDYHLPRALAVCRGAGVDAIGAGSESAPEMWWKNHLRESLSWIKYKLGF
ncbi:MAG: YdcF family protein [Oscillospiraceae bacterium]|nr:YdcF family protein [Oscillospiraceae bacterium]